MTTKKAADATKKKKKKRVKRKKKNGRPLRLTKKVADEIIASILAGNWVETACAQAGVCKQTFYNWMKKGREGENPRLAHFVDAVDIAQAEAEVRLLGVIDKCAMEGDWKAAMAILERKFPDRFQLKSQLQLPPGASGAVLVLPDNGRGPPPADADGGGDGD